MAICQTTFGQLQFAAPVVYADHFNPGGFALADFTGDGKIDIATINYQSANIALFVNQGSGAFASQTIVASIDGPISIVSGDFNADGKQDIAATDANTAIRIFLGNGNGTFTAGSVINGDAENLAVADFNSDGKLDIATTASYNSTLTLLLGTGTGTFTSAGTFNTAGNNFAMTAADFNHDGKPDVATANYNANIVSVLINNGSGGFATVVTYPVGALANQIVTADFNADGRPDLATASNGSNVSVLLNNGNGTFAAATNNNVRSYLLTTADYNGDGKVDIVTGGSGSFTVLLGNGSGIFSNAGSFASGGEALFYSASADLNGDGKIDLVIANPDNDNFSVILNTSQPCPKPVISTNGPTTFCAGDSVVLTATASTSYLWSNAATTRSITVRNGGSYTVTTTSPGGCTNITSNPVTITVNALPATPTASVTQPTLTVATGKIVVTSPTGAGLTYSIDSTTYQASTTFNNLTPGSYKLTAKNSTNCTSLILPVTINPQPTRPSLTSVNISSNNANTSLARTGNTITLSFTASEAVNLPTVTIDGHNIIPVSSGGNSYSASYVMAATDPEGPVTFTIDVTSAASIPGAQVTSTTNGSHVTFDKTAPSVASINRQNPATQITGATNLVYRVTFSKPVVNVDISDFSLVATNTAAGTIASVSASFGTAIDVTVNSATGDGDLRLDLKSSGTGIADSAGNQIPGGFNTGQSYTLDHTAPSVTSIQRLTPSAQLTNATAVLYRVTFSDPVNGVDIGDFTLTATNTASGHIASVSSSSGSIIDVTVNGFNGNGDIRLDLKASGTGIADNGNNPISGGFTSGEAYTIDHTPPTLATIINSNNANASFAKTGNTVTLTFIPSEVINSPSVSIDGHNLTVIPAGGNSYSANYVMTASDPEGPVTFTIDNFSDLAGNPGTQVTTTTNFSHVTFDKTAPSVTSINRQNPATQITTASTLVYRVNFSEGVTGVDINDFVLAGSTANGTIASVVAAPGFAKDVTVNGVSGTGTLRLDLKASGTGIADSAGNAINGGFTSGDTYIHKPIDTIPPTVPTNIVVDYTGRSFVNLNWDNSSDSAGVTAYDVYRNGVKKYTTTKSFVTADSLLPNTTYTFTITARDSTGNTSGMSSPASATTRGNGLNYRYYQGTWTFLPDFTTLTPVQTGNTANVDIGVRPAGVNDNFSFVWEGYINIPAAGSYTFETTSDDGSKLYFNSLYTPPATELVNNDGIHAPFTVTGTVNVPAPGLYPIAVTFFEKDGGQSLQLFWRGPGFSRSQIPDSAFTGDTHPPLDTVAPSIPGNLTVVSTTANSVALDWDNSTDNTGVVAYDVYVNNVKTYTTTTSQLTADNLVASTAYVFKVKARDLAGNTSGFSNPVTGTTISSSSGLAYKYYEGSWTSLPDFNTLTPIKIGSSPNVDINERNVGVNDNFAFKWEGFINIPTAGTYTFETVSDDGSKLYFNTAYAASATALVNNDGLHAATSKTGTVNIPSAGMYPIAITFFEFTGDQSMQIFWTGPNFTRQQIPNSAFVASTPPAITGVNYRYYEGTWTILPDFNALTPVKTGNTPNIDISVRTPGRDDNFGFVWEGYINIQTPGNYTFETVSDDGSKLYFNTTYSNAAIALVDNNGVHAPVSQTGNIYIPDAGAYRIAVTFFEYTGGQSIQVYWSGPNFPRQLIPNSAFTTGIPPADNTAPSTPANLTARYSGKGFVYLDWDDATDDVGVVAYDIYVGGVKKYTSVESSFTADSLTANTGYNFTVKARDLAGNSSAASNTASPTTETAANGLKYRFYQGTFNTLPNFNTLTPVSVGASANVDIGVRPGGVNDFFAFVWEGYIKIPTGGAYTFETVSDDGSKLYFNSFYVPGATPLVNNDGVHAPLSATGNVNIPAAGLYPIAITFFEKDGGQSMQVYWSGPGIPRQLIPNSAFTESGTLTAQPAPSGTGSLNTIMSGRSEDIVIRRIYPSPFTDRFDIDFYNTSAVNDISVGVYDLRGKLLYLYHAGNLSAGNTSLKVNLSGTPLTDGMYLVTVNVNGIPSRMMKLVRAKR